MKTYSSALIIIALMGALGFMTGCDRRPTPTTSNVVLITFDTVRADHFKCYGKQDAETPTVDYLAEEGVLFENCSSPVPITLPAHTSMMTGLYPPKSGVRTNGSYFVSDDITTLAEILYGAGYQTAAFVSARVLDQQYGLNQGFQTYSDRMSITTEKDSVVIAQRQADEITSEASEWLGRKDPKRPYFLWVHYYDPHAAYNPPDMWKARFPNDPYSGEIAYADSQLSKLLEAIDIHSTLIVFAGDHGESLGEHGEATHAYFAYEATQHVPLIFRYPDERRKGTRNSEQVSLVDITPTVLDYLGLENPDPMEGISLLREQPAADRPVYVESITPLTFDWSPLAGFKTLQWKYIAAPTEELYSIPDDPHELRNLVREYPEKVEEFRKSLRKMRPLEALKEAEETKKTLDSEDREMLAALGYVGGSKMKVPDDFSQLPDPKDKIDDFNLYQLARRDFFSKSYQNATEKVLKLLESEPDLALAHYLLGQVYLDSKQFSKAIQALEKTLELDRDNPSVWFTLAKAYNRDNRFDKAVQFCTDGVKIFSEEAGLFDQLGIAYRMKGDVANAISCGEKATDLLPKKAEYLNNLGTAYMAAEELKEAEEVLKRAVELEPEFAEGRYNLGVVYLRTNEYGEAEEQLQRVLSIDEKNLDALVQLNKALLYQNKAESALKISERILAINPRHQEAHYFRSVAFRQKEQYEKAEAELRLFLKSNPKAPFAYADLVETLLAHDPPKKKEAAQVVQEMKAKGLTVPEALSKKTAQ